MEVLVGPPFGIAGSGTYVRGRTQTQSQSQSQTQEKISSSSCLFLKEDDVGVPDQAGEGTGTDLGLPDLSSDSSSSIGAPGDSDDDAEEEDGVVSSGGNGGLASLGSIEDSLPIKRGLSNHFAGKSKSFANLSDISSVKDLLKPENPFNKKRRILLAKKRSRKSFYTWQNPNSMPLLALNEDDEDGDDKETSSSSSSSAAAAQKPKLQPSKLKIAFKSQSCFSLTDLQVEEEEEEEHQ